MAGAQVGVPLGRLEVGVAENFLGDAPVDDHESVTFSYRTSAS